MSTQDQHRVQEVAVEELSPKTEEVFLPANIQQQLDGYADLKQNVETLRQYLSYLQYAVIAIIMAQYEGIVSPAVPFFITLCNIAMLKVLEGKTFFGKKAVTYFLTVLWLTYFILLVIRLGI